MATPEAKTAAVQTVGLHVDTSVAVPDKAALCHTTVATSPLDKSSSHSGITTPRSENGNPFDTDVEAMVTNTSTSKCTRSSVLLTRKNDNQVWPGKDHWKQRAKTSKKNRRSCNCLSRLNRRTRIAVKVLIVMLVVGIAVGVGFGVSKPLGASIWGKSTS